MNRKRVIPRCILYEASEACKTKQSQVTRIVNVNVRESKIIERWHPSYCICGHSANNLIKYREIIFV